ncbi:alpha-xylosidase [Demequina lutea]|uniref:alpha-D-xyloside xylohydrolase n=1 Tax=Demequina lutea TaxID=431489 RepID=A0A7Z0CGV8_9MICO|nr:alpha-xylosidase [Demequina lutea]NYI40154.1 alpha-D-xyloside xylohydrolase [Demequina lutea]
MKFTDGFWHLRPGVTASYAQEAYDITADGDGIVVTAPARRIESRGNVLNLPVLTTTLTPVADGVIKVRIEHHTGGRRSPGFEVNERQAAGGIAITDGDGTVTAGTLRAVIRRGAPWDLSFWHADVRLTGSGAKAQGYMTLADGAPVAAEPTGVAGVTTTGLAPSRTYVHEQLDLGVGEVIYGLGERFGPLAKNGQVVDIWNADGGTSSELAYKSIPFYMSNRGYGVLVNQPEHVSFEVGSESVERVQFSTAGEAIEYFVIDGPTPKDVIDRYTALTGRPAEVPAWSYGLWLSTSFTTDYDEATVNSFVDGMRDRGIPLSAFHFDCFWMREFNWTDLEWDARVFPDPEGMLHRLHTERDLHICAWINPYIAQRSALFAEGKEKGYLVKRADGSVWQWDWWVAGMGLVDFTNPEATRWFQDKLRGLLTQGVDALKTDFGERIPLDVVWHDGTPPETMHNLYTQLYNKAVFEVLVEERGEREAVLFARSATAGGQQFPIHWGGDNTSTFPSMAETLRGGLSLASSGFGYWSHDIGGFEGTPDPAVFKRWVAFGLLSSHSRLHGSDSYRVPWAFDEEAVTITAKFAQLKNTLMPYIYAASADAAATGVSVARPMYFEFPSDPAVAYLDRQYMLGSHLLVAPVMSASGDVEFYLPAGTWTNFWTGETVAGGAWRREQHGFDTVPLYVREGAAIGIGAHADRPDYDYLDGLTIRLYGAPEVLDVTMPVIRPDGSAHAVRITGPVDAPVADREGVTVQVVSRA